MLTMVSALYCITNHLLLLVFTETRGSIRSVPMFPLIRLHFGSLSSHSANITMSHVLPRKTHRINLCDSLESSCHQHAVGQHGRGNKMIKGAGVRVAKEELKISSNIWGISDSEDLLAHLLWEHGLYKHPYRYSWKGNLIFVPAGQSNAVILHSDLN